LVQLRAGGAADAALRARLDRPTPRIDIARGLSGIAHAGIDLSDGLLADLGHVCTASNAGAMVELEALPTSPMLAARFNAEARQVLQASGGDDYELCFTALPTQRDAIAQLAREHDIAITRVGRIVAASGVSCVDAHGQPWHAPRSGYAHFAD
jgi:thiamine-monophosphate kinase